MPTRDPVATTGLCSKDLIALIRVSLGTLSPDGLPAELNGEALLDEARKTGMVALLFHHPAASRFHEDFHQALKRSYIAATAHYTRLAKSLATLCAEFHRCGIDAVPFKGIGLSQRLFGDIAFRSCTDHDILVKKPQARAALQVLLDLGFQLSSHSPSADAADCLERFYSIELRHPESKVLVDLQWDIANGYAPPPSGEEALFLRTTSLSILGQPVPFFDDAVTLYLLCIHGAKNSWCELRALLDLAMMIKVFPEPVWRQTVEWLEAQGLPAMMTTGVLLAHQLLGIFLPEAAAARVDRRARRLAAAIQIHWRKKGCERPSAWQRFVWDLRFREGLREKTRYLFFRLRPTRTDWRNQGPAAPLLYLKRFARILLPKPS